MKKRAIIRWAVVVVTLLMCYIIHAIWTVELDFKGVMFGSKQVVVGLQMDQSKLGSDRLHRVYYNETIKRYSVIVQISNPNQRNFLKEASELRFELDGIEALERTSITFYDAFFKEYAFFYLEDYPKSEMLEVIRGDEVVECTFSTEKRSVK